jgi:hypothetical protein
MMAIIVAAIPKYSINNKLDRGSKNFFDETLFQRNKDVIIGRVSSAVI